MRQCIKCGLYKPVEDFRQGYKGSNRHICRKCEDLRKSDKVRKMRRDGVKVERWILTDSRNTDKKKGRANDLTLEWVKSAISNGCSYCGRCDLRMTLDRIDNSKGHTMDNVVSACVTCNCIRRDMPYAAWLIIVPAIRQARELGLFGEWVCAYRAQT